MGKTKFNNINDIQIRISQIEGGSIKDLITKIPILSYITFTNNDNEYDSGGFLISISKTYFKIITNVEDFNSITKIKYSNIKKIYYVYNTRSYHREYQNDNKDKKQEINKRYYQQKKERLNEQKLICNYKDE
jgi:hypothetical protein